jgi:hypothetical protein
MLATRSHFINLPATARLTPFQGNEVVKKTSEKVHARCSTTGIDLIVERRRH